jgi:DNA polymerase III epsilon subunit-like protein
VGKPEFKEVEPIISKVFDKSDLFVAHNLDFDAGFLLNEYSLIGKTLPNVNGFCTMEEGRWATSNGKKPNLGELCYCLEVDYNPDEAHAALYDTYKTAECFFKGVRLGGYNIKDLLK